MKEEKPKKPKKKHHDEPTPDNNYDTKMALAEIMEAKKELVAQRAAEKPKKEDTKPELL